MRSRVGMKDERMFRSVVFPAPVPPDTRMLSRARTQPWRSCSIGAVIVFRFTSSFAEITSWRNLRIERCGPSIETGGMTALTREPSGRRASNHGRRVVEAAAPIETIRSMIWSRC